MTMPLEGIRVLDLTRLAPGPYCTMFLGDMGADVLKIQDPGKLSGRRAEQGDQKAAEAFGEGVKNLVAPHNPLHRNKRSMTLNLKNEEGHRVFLKLVEKYDVLVEESRPGVAQRLGIDYETLKKVNPRLIYCAITGYGQDGPYSRLAGHDINYISVAGVLGLIGEQGRDPSIPLNIIGDMAAGGLQGVIGVLLALAAREKTGRGQLVDVSMTDGAVSLIGQFISDSYHNKQFPKRGETFLSGTLPFYKTYPTKDGKHISVGCMEPWFYANLCRAFGREDLVPMQWVPESHAEVEAAFRKGFATKTADEWFKILSQVDVCAAKVNDLEDLENDPHLIHRQMIVEIDHPTEGKIKQMGISIKLSETPGKIKTLAPTFGQHTESELMQLGYSKKQIAELRQCGAIG